MSSNTEPMGPFLAGPGTYQEIGIMAGFIAAFILITVIYLIVWKAGNKREEAKEMEPLERQKVLAEKTNPRNTRVFEKEGVGERGCGIFIECGGLGAVFWGKWGL